MILVTGVVLFVDAGPGLGAVPAAATSETEFTKSRLEVAERTGLKTGSRLAALATVVHAEP